jgi:hypothetical protein
MTEPQSQPRPRQAPPGPRPARPARGDAQTGPPQIRPAARPKRAAVVSRGRLLSGLFAGSGLTIAAKAGEHWPRTLMAALWLELTAVVLLTALIVAWREGHLGRAADRGRDRLQARAARNRQAGDDDGVYQIGGPRRSRRDAADEDGGYGDDDWYGGSGWQPARPRRGGGGPAGRRASGRIRADLANRQFSVPKAGGEASAEAKALAAKISEFRAEGGDDLEAWFDERAADFFLIAEAISDAHDGMVSDTGLDEIPASAVHDMADEVAEVGTGAVKAKETIVRYYEDPINFADEGGKMPVDGQFWERR